MRCSEEPGNVLTLQQRLFQAALLISCCLAPQAERCNGFGAGEPSQGGVELKEPPVPVWKGFELEIVVVEAGVHMWFPSLAIQTRERLVSGLGVSGAW